LQNPNNTATVIRAPNGTSYLLGPTGVLHASVLIQTTPKHAFDGNDFGLWQLLLAVNDNSSIQDRTVVLIKVWDVPEPGPIAFAVLAAGSVIGLIARKRKA
jgi:hypothetical protein